tara:strand:- start:636 stop:1331 length:696 start_codon:yes stop_codon:yes gene_type:complete
MKFSIVIPIYNEKDSIFNLVDEINKNIDESIKYEIVIVNDCSDDLTNLDIKNLSNYKKISILNLKKNMGQSNAIYQGIKKAKSNTIVTLDGDGQNDPRDINLLCNIYFDNENILLVGGIRQKRKDNLIKRISSKIANNIRKIILKDNCPDTGCSLKVFDKNIFLSFPFFDGLHRFLPALFKGWGKNTRFVAVNHRPRLSGISKYGTFKRALKGIRDLIKVLNIINNYNREK